MVKMLVVVLVLGLFVVGGIGVSYSYNDVDCGLRDSSYFNCDDIRKAEELYVKAMENQLPIEEQIEELRSIEIKMYGKEISDYDAIRDEYNGK